VTLRSLLFLVFGVLAIPRSAGAVERDTADQEELSRVRARSPRAAELIEQGEASGVAGRLEEADSLFRQAAALDPMGTLVWRLDCAALTALGRRNDAIEACTSAVANGHTNAAGRALVRAMVAGPKAPTPTDLFQGLTLTSLERRRQPPGALLPVEMACDIAESLGDRAMLQDCVNHLAPIAPEAAETRKAMALLQAQCPPGRFWGGWLGILALTVVTALHALRRSARRGGGEPEGGASHPS
jgi:tetratricopeptide (TPR) repeat protein